MKDRELARCATFLVFLVSSSSIFNEFVHDDVPAIVRNPGKLSNFILRMKDSL